MMKTSMPLTFSLISTRVSPSLKAVTWAFEGYTQIFRYLPGELQIRISGKYLILSSISRPLTATMGWLGREDSNLRMQDPKFLCLTA